MEVYDAYVDSMKIPEEPMAEIQLTIRKNLEAFERRLTGELTEKLTEREKSYSAERSDYLQQIDALRIKAARTEGLEAENRKINAELEEARQRHREHPRADGLGGVSKVDRSNATVEAETNTEYPIVNIEEYNRVKDDLVKLESDYGRLVWARDHLVTKVREQKDALRQWKEYRKNWILKHPNKRISNLRPSCARASPPTTAEHSRASSAPAPPALPEAFTPSFGGVPMSTSPHQNAPAIPKHIEYRHDQASEHRRRDRRSLSGETSISQAGNSIASASDTGDVTEATPESEVQAEPIKTEPATGGSSPIMIFERSLKRRHSGRGSAQNVRVHEDDQRDGATAGTLLPKGEQISSPISATPVFHLDEPHDSLDLDDVGGHLYTPRKRQRMAQERLRSSMMVPSITVQEEEDMFSTMTAAGHPRPLDNEHPGIEDKRDEQAGLSTEDYMTLPKKMAEEEKKARKDERMARQHAHNERVDQRLEAAERKNLMFDLPRSSSLTTKEPDQPPNAPNDPGQARQRKLQLANPVILQPRDVNASVLPRTSDPFANRKRPCPPSRRDRGAAYVPALAEDGETFSSNGDALKTGKKSKGDQNDSHDHADKECKAPSTHHRLGALLTKPSREKSILIPEKPAAGVSPDQAWSKTPVPRSVNHDRYKGPATPRSLPARRSELESGPEIQSALANFEPVDATTDRYSKSAQAVTKSTRSFPAFPKPSLVDYSKIRPEHEPLRARPVHRLNLQDFKFNPAHSDYAYHETVRRHDEKKSLSGCADRHCARCKGLRTFVTDSEYKTPQKPGESEDQADWRLMQGFLGDNHGQLRHMSTKEKSDLLIEAKVKEFADRYGCHRQAFSRAREAPGFWEIDFPTTQEEAEDRAAADIMEREKVQERYWEACRRNGKWMFADE